MLLLLLLLSTKIIKVA